MKEKKFTKKIRRFSCKRVRFKGQETCLLHFAGNEKGPVSAEIEDNGWLSTVNK